MQLREERVWKQGPFFAKACQRFERANWCDEWVEDWSFQTTRWGAGQKLEFEEGQSIFEKVSWWLQEVYPIAQDQTPNGIVENTLGCQEDQRWVWSLQEVNFGSNDWLSRIRSLDEAVMWPTHENRSS